MFPKFEASYVEYEDGLMVIFSWNVAGVPDDWLFVIVIATYADEALVEVAIVFALAPNASPVIESEVSCRWRAD